MDVEQRRRVRTIALIVLVALAVVALRGYLPDVDRAPRRRSSGGVASVAVYVLLGGSIAVLVLAFVATVRRGTTPRLQRIELPHRFDSRSIDRRAVLALLAVIAGVVIAVLAIGSSGIGVEQRPDSQQQSQRQQDDPASKDGAMTPDPVVPQSDRNNTLVPVFTGVTVAMIVLLVAGTVVMARCNPRVEQTPTDDVVAGQPDSESTLVRVAELGLAEVSEPGREPRAAIIACYIAMEGGLADAPDAAPLESDTPSEVLARAVDHGVLRSNAAQRLVSLFTEARFSPHDMTEAQRESAEALLRQVLDDLRGSAWAG